MGTPNLQSMHAFRCVVETSSFNAAARRMGITGGAVSKLVAKLESELGTRLLQRTTRAVSVTEAGTAFYESAVRILDEFEVASEKARLGASAATGNLKASVPSSFALMWLSRRLPAFLARHANVSLDLGLNDRFVDLVEEGFDCAVRIATQLPDSNLVTRRIGMVDRVLVAAPMYLEHAPALSRPEDLKAHDCLIYSQHTEHDGASEWPFSGTRAARPVRVRGRYRVNNSLMLREALIAGLGVTLTPRFVVDDLLAKRSVVELLPSHRPRPHAIFGVVAHSRHIPQKVKVFLEFMEQELAQSGYSSPRS